MFDDTKFCLHFLRICLTLLKDVGFVSSKAMSVVRSFAAGFIMKNGVILGESKFWLEMKLPI
jgi:hypothetical protein